MTATVTIQGIAFEVSTPFQPGHVCSDVDAAVLNQARNEKLRVNFAKRVSTRLGLAPSEADIAALRVEFAAYEAAYSFRAGWNNGDPIQRTAHEIARAVLKARLAKEGLKQSDIPEAKWDANIARIAALPEILAEAERRVEATRLVAEEALTESL